MDIYLVILAGGLGTRLRPRVANCPKPLAPIGDDKFIDFLLKFFDRPLISNIIISTGYMSEQFHQHFRSSEIQRNLKIISEPKQLGTGGGLKYAIKELPANAKVLACNGDTLNFFDLEKFCRDLRGNDMRLLVRKSDDISRYGVVEIGDSLITGFSGRSSSNTGFISAGVYFFEAKTLQNFHQTDVFSLEDDFISKSYEHLKFEPFVSDGFFIDIGVPSDYEAARSILPKLDFEEYGGRPKSH